MVTRKKYSGVHTALITPFKNQEIDYEALYSLILKQIDSSIRAITLFGTTGEGPTISNIERRSILREVKKWLPKDIYLIFGCGSPSTEETLQQAFIAQEYECHAIQVVTPPYNKPSQEGLYNHFKKIHNSTSIDILLYNIPGRTSSSIEKETVSRLFDLDRIYGIKEASNSLIGLIETIELAKKYGNKISVLTGDDLYTLAAVALGADGVVSVLSNLLPKQICELFEYSFSNYKEAQKILYFLKPIIQSCFLETNPGPIKYMLSKQNLIHNELRLPLVPISQETEQKILPIIDSHSF